MTAEPGHAANRVYMAQDGSFHLNGAAFYNDAEADIADSLETLNGLNATELGYLDGATPGTATASKVVIYDAAGKIVRNSATPAAAGTNQGTATALTKNLNAVTGADGTVGVALPVGAAGDEIVVINTVTTAVLKVYPETGGAINGGSANASVSVGPGRVGRFVCTAALTWVVGADALQTATNAALNAVVQGAAAGYKVARGVAAVTGTATVVTGLATVVAVVATPQSDPDGVALAMVSATIGDQAGSPAAGSVILKAWKVTATGNATLIAATAAANINWVAVGT